MGETEDNISLVDHPVLASFCVLVIVWEQTIQRSKKMVFKI